LGRFPRDALIWRRWVLIAEFLVLLNHYPNE
jgi:hypothetical protein